MLRFLRPPQFVEHRSPGKLQLRDALANTLLSGVEDPLVRHDRGIEVRQGSLPVLQFHLRQCPAVQPGSRPLVGVRPLRLGKPTRKKIDRLLEIALLKNPERSLHLVGIDVRFHGAADHVQCLADTFAPHLGMHDAGERPQYRSIGAEKNNVRHTVRGEDSEAPHQRIGEPTGNHDRLARPPVLIHQCPDAIAIVRQEGRNHLDPLAHMLIGKREGVLHHSEGLHLFAPRVFGNGSVDQGRKTRLRS